MTQARAKTIIARIKTPEHLDTPHKSRDCIAEGVAAAFVMHKDHTGKKNHKGRACKSILEHLRRSQSLEYLTNGPRLMALLDEEGGTLFGTTTVGAIAKQIKNRPGNVCHISERSARLPVELFSLAKALSTSLRARTLGAATENMSQGDTIRALLREVRTLEPKWVEPLALEQAPSPKIDPEPLPANAKKISKQNKSGKPKSAQPKKQKGPKFMKTKARAATKTKTAKIRKKAGKK